MLISAAFVAALAFLAGCVFGHLVASMFCSHSRGMSYDPIPAPEPIVSAPVDRVTPLVAPVNLVEEVYQKAGLTLVDGRWTAPATPDDYRRAFHAAWMRARLAS